MASIDAMIKWMTDNEGKVAYAMVRPWGNGNPPQYDCSAAVITALRSGGFMDIPVETTEILQHFKQLPCQKLQSRLPEVNVNVEISF